MKSQSGLFVLLAVCMGVAVVGFLRGTSLSDYDMATPVTHWTTPSGGDVPAARSYGEQHVEDDEAGVATACLDCHEDRATLAGRGAHTEHPIGMAVPAGVDLTALMAGGARVDITATGERTVSCRTCHRPHSPSQRSRLTIPVEDGALCVTCHADHGSGRSAHPVSGPIEPALRASVAALGGATSGGLTCTSCHVPHAATAGTLLRTAGAGAAACRTCHTEQAGALGRDGHGGQSCETCHGMHDAPAHVGKGPVAGDVADQSCVDCHAGGGAPPQVGLGAGHPLWKGMTAAMTQTGHAGTVGCTDCHVAHGDQSRLLVAATVAATCTGCHAEKATVTGTKHDAAVVAVGGEDATCLSCHAVHGDGERPTAAAGVNPASAACLTCHDGGTGARKVGPWTHPAGVLLTVGGLPFRYAGQVPYFGPDGLRSTDRKVGEITCQTCHDVHRWRHDESAHPGNVEGTEQNSFLRDPDEVVEFCTICHGNDGRPNFRFFHSDDYRGKADGAQAPP